MFPSHESHKRGGQRPSFPTLVKKVSPSSAGSSATTKARGTALGEHLAAPKQTASVAALVTDFLGFKVVTSTFGGPQVVAQEQQCAGQSQCQQEEAQIGASDGLGAQVT